MLTQYFELFLFTLKHTPATKDPPINLQKRKHARRKEIIRFTHMCKEEGRKKKKILCIQFSERTQDHSCCFPPQWTPSRPGFLFLLPCVCCEFKRDWIHMNLFSFSHLEIPVFSTSFLRGKAMDLCLSPLSQQYWQRSFSKTWKWLRIESGFQEL